MLNLLKSIYILTCVVILSKADSFISYDGYKLIKVTPEEESQLQVFQEFKEHDIGSQYHIPKVGVGYVHVLVEEEDFEQALEILQEFGDDYFSVVMSDVGKFIRSHKIRSQSRNGKLYWDEYYTLNAIYEFLDAQVIAHPTFAEVESIGTTYEGRNLTIIKISNSGETKPAIWIDSNIHAREWITGAVGTYIIDQLLNGPDTGIKQFLNDFDFYILPIANPDGFEYTYTTDRFWRKTRSNSTSSQGCKGADPNRNFDAFWMENGGASSDPCSNVYAGESVFSEPETEAMADYITSIESRLRLYLSLHSAGQYILLPTGKDNIKIPEYADYMKIGEAAAEAHSLLYGTTFTTGSVFDLMYTATGSSMDWAYTKIPSARMHVTYELRDKGQFGHLLPPDQILPSCEEFIEGLKVILEEMK